MGIYVRLPYKWRNLFKKKKKSDNAVAHETQSSLDVLVIVGFFLKMNAVF